MLKYSVTAGKNANSSYRTFHFWIREMRWRKTVLWSASLAVNVDLLPVSDRILYISAEMIFDHDRIP